MAATLHRYDGHGEVAPKLARHGGAFIAIARQRSACPLQDVWAYLKSIPDPPPVKNVPLLSQ
jgi:hypothetical protein